MKKLNSKYMLLSIFMFSIAITSIYVIIFVDNSIRYFIATGIAVVIGIVCTFLSRSKGTLIEYEIDERDKVNIDQSSRKTLQFINYVMAGIIFSCLTLYSATKANIYLIIAFTELTTLLLLLIISLVTQNYYEKRN